MSERTATGDPGRWAPRIVTRWHARCEPGWRAWAERHGYDVVCLEARRSTTPIAPAVALTGLAEAASSRASRSCAVYDRLIWMDADVVVNPSAPSITAGVPIEAVGAVDEFATPTREQHARTLAKLFRQWEAPQAALRAQPVSPPNGTHRAGFEPGFDGVVQTGVMVLSPDHHSELLERVYHGYEEQAGAELRDAAAVVGAARGRRRALARSALQLHLG